MLRNSFWYSSKKDWAGIVKDLKPVCTARSKQATLDPFAEFSETWVANARPLRPLPSPIADPPQINPLDVRRHQHLGGILNKYRHAA